MRLPIRIQRRRARGWRMPAHTKYVGRGSLYGNPYRVARSARELEEGGELVVASADEAVARYREWIEQTREGGRARLSTKFVEWLMGLPEGHVTGADLGLTREQQLRLLGNGVVPQQGAAAIYQLTKIALQEAA